MSKYINISVEEMEQFLVPLGFQKISISGTKEIVFAKRVDTDNLQLSLRIYSGIDQNSGQSRTVGADAIRVDLFGMIENKPTYLGGSKRVHRVAGWRENLQNRLNNWLDFLPKEKCPECGYPMVLRTAKSTGNKFLGCVRYPLCRHTKAYQAA